MTTEFDKTDTFEEICRPLVNRLVQECQLARIPFFWSACVKNDKEGSTYVNDGMMCGSSGIKLKDDQITKHMMVAAGADIKVYDDPVEVMFDSLPVS